MKIIIKPILTFIYLLIVNIIFKSLELISILVLECFSLFWYFKLFHSKNEYILIDTKSIISNTKSAFKIDSDKPKYIYKNFYNKIFMLEKGIEVFIKDDEPPLKVLNRCGIKYVGHLINNKKFVSYDDSSYTLDIFSTDQIYNIKDYT